MILNIIIDFWQQKILIGPVRVTKVIANIRKDGPPAITYGTAKPSAASPEVFSPLWGNHTDSSERNVLL
jgi:hypothetical protein